MTTEDKKGFTFIELCVCIVILIGLVFLVRGCAGYMGFGGKNPPVVAKTQTLASQTPSRDTGRFTSDQSDPIADAKQKLEAFEQKRTEIEPLLERAEADRDELIAKLREIGVNSTADLKGNARGQRLAESVLERDTEIAGLQGQMTLLDTVILDARAFIRRVEREAAGISEEDMRKLAEQLKDVQDRTDGPRLPVTPLDIDAAVEKAFQVSPSKQKAVPLERQSLSTQLVGKWQISEGREKGTIEFTKGGSALLVWSDGLRNALGESVRRATLTYALSGTSLKITDPRYTERDSYLENFQIEIEVISKDEMIFVITNSTMSFDWLEGRVVRAK